MAGSLSGRLLRRIARAGPLTVAEYMAEALHDREAGYYARRDPLGAAGDFTTAPEVSQMFGELLGLWTLAAWRAQGSPPGACLVELGPGRGTLMADALRAIAGASGGAVPFEVRLVETSPRLRAIQARTLAAARPAWSEDLSGLPDRPCFLIANEFFDALPIRRLVRRDGAWREVLVAADAAGTGLAWAVDRAPSPLAATLPDELRRGAADGETAELCPAADAVLAAAAGRIAARGGAALVVDYGSERGARGATLQAVRAHRPVDPLDSPGLADLSSHVDFARLRGVALEAGCACLGPVEQGRFLRALGVERRAAALARRAGPEGRAGIAAALDRLIGADAMGKLFKAMAVVPADGPEPDGFAEPGARPGGGESAA